MSVYPIFLSIVCVVRNQASSIEQIAAEISSKVAPLVNDYELILVDNASDDDSLLRLKCLTSASGMPNIQVYALTKAVDQDTASWVGLENALGDFVVVIDPLLDSPQILPTMLDYAVSGADVVFATNEQRPAQSLPYRIAFGVFNFLYKRFNGIHLAKEAPQYRVLSNRVINFILQHPQPAMTYRHLPASGGFAKVNLTYSAKPNISHTKPSRTKHLGSNIDRGMRLLVSTTRTPMRLVTSLSLFGAVANLFYTLYVVGIAIFKPHVAEGWVSMSFQQSGMFFLISLVLLVLGEYILNMASLTNGGPPYYVGQEFTSTRMSRREKLNVEETVIQTLAEEIAV
jgi:hypothetical protein